MQGTTQQAEQLRADLATLTAQASLDLAHAWQGFSGPVQARDGLIDILPRLIAVYGEAAGTVAADWYDEQRDQAEVNKRFRAIVAELPADLGTVELARWAVGPLFSREQDAAAALALAQGGAQRRILNVARSTVTGSAVADPSAHGWQRVGTGECAFCRMLIARGAVYTQRTADFASHDHCHCAAVPAWSGRPIPVKPYTPNNRNITDADRARVRAWLREH